MGRAMLKAWEGSEFCQQRMGLQKDLKPQITMIFKCHHAFKKNLFHKNWRLVGIPWRQHFLSESSKL